MGTKPATNIKGVTLLLNMNKSEIARKGIEFTAHLHLTWSCYERNEMACGRCQSRTLCLKALEDAGVEDKTPYTQ